MLYFNRKFIPFFLILSLLSNIFISLFHFAHEGHSIDPLTGRTIHTHYCETVGCMAAHEGYNSEAEKHHEETDPCNALDIVFNQSLQTFAQNFEAPSFTGTSYSSQYPENIFHVRDILLFAPKNSPPVI